MLLCIGRSTKTVLAIILLVSSFVTYFGNVYDVVISGQMIRNALYADYDEAIDLITVNMFVSVLVLGVMPSILVWKVRISKVSFIKGVLTKCKNILCAILVMAVLLVPFEKFYASFIREHKNIRVYVSPVYWIYSAGKVVVESLRDTPDSIEVVGKDAKIIHKNREKKKIVIMVVGEALRADKLPFNGYHRNTMPLTSKEEVLNFSNMYSCGTATQVSVPCMFSVFDRKDYSNTKVMYTENTLDVLSHTGAIEILWRDNNSSSSGVADRVKYETIRNEGWKKKHQVDCRDEDKIGRYKKKNDKKYSECRDDLMLVGLDDYVSKNKRKDIFIVLHQLGSHGPAYYKRYPRKFEKFKPVCKTSMLNECTDEEINNAYDNTVLYTDYFLSETIGFLKKYDKSHDVAMLYMSDHGESLGEGGLYLHGIPYFMAPDAQKHIASFMWFGDGFKGHINISKLHSYKSEEFSHDNLPHTILGLFDVSTSIYSKEKDILFRSKR